MSLEHAPQRDGERLLMSLLQVRETLGGIGNTTVWKLIAAGAFETVTIGRKRYGVAASVKAYVDRLRAAEGKVA
jgi:hypothetical protein